MGNRQRMTKDNNGKKFTRRRMIEMGAAGAAFSMAGCSGGGSGDTGAETGTGDGSDSSTSGDGSAKNGDIVEETYNITMNQDVTKGHWQIFNPKQTQRDTQTSWLCYDKFVHYVPASGEAIPMILSDWSFEGTQVKFTVDDSYTWDDGDDVTAADVVAQFKLENLVSDPALYNGATQTGEYEFVLSLNGEISELVLFSSLGDRDERLFVKADIYSEWLDKLSNASTQAEKESIKEDLVTWVPAELEEPIPNGPYRVTSMSSTAVEMEKREGVPYSDSITIPKITSGGASNETGNKKYTQGDHDAGQIENWSQYKKIWEAGNVDNFLVVDRPSYGGYHWLFNFNTEPLNDVRVRQAIAHIVDREGIEATLDRHQAEEYPCGLSSQADMISNWVNDVDSLNTYGKDSANTQKATALLNDAGYTKDGKWFKDSNGNSISFDIYGPTWANMANNTQATASQLRKFGIEAEAQVIESSQFFNTYDSGEFGMLEWWWGNPHPYTAFQDLVDLTSEGNVRGMPKVFEVPEVGNPNGSTEEIDIHEEQAKLASASGEQANEISTRLAWAWNQALPTLPVTSGVRYFLFNSEKFDVPEDSNPDTITADGLPPKARWRHLSTMWPRLDLINAKYE